MAPVAVAMLLAGLEPAVIERPVRAEIHVAAGRTQVLIVGRSSQPIAVRYELTLRNGGNLTTQSGSARLEPGRRKVLADVLQSGTMVRGNLIVHIGSASYAQPISEVTAPTGNP